jgi:hypothetical protein
MIDSLCYWTGAAFLLCAAACAVAFLCGLTVEFAVRRVYGMQLFLEFLVWRGQKKTKEGGYDRN